MTPRARPPCPTNRSRPSPIAGRSWTPSAARSKPRRGYAPRSCADGAPQWAATPRSPRRAGVGRSAGARWRTMRNLSSTCFFVGSWIRRRCASLARLINRAAHHLRAAAAGSRSGPTCAPRPSGCARPPAGRCARATSSTSAASGSTPPRRRAATSPSGRRAIWRASSPRCRPRTRSTRRSPRSSPTRSMCSPCSAAPAIT